MEEKNDNLTNDLSSLDDSQVTPDVNAAGDASVPDEQPNDAANEVSDEDFDPQQYILQQVNSLPTAIRKYINSDSVVAANKEIIARHGLAEKDAYLIYSLELRTFFGSFPLGQFPDVLWSELTWPDEEEDKARALALDVLGNIFLPAQVFLGDVAGEIFSLGGNPSDFKVDQIDVRKLSYSEGVDGIVRALGEDFVEFNRLPRLRYLIETRLRGVRDEGEFREQLMRPVKVGGLELSEEAADRVLAVVGVEMQLTSYVEAKEEIADKGDVEETETSEYTTTDIKKLYSGTKEERETIKKRVDRFRKVTDDDPQKMADAFHEVLYPPDLGPVEPSFVLAGLLAMADSGELLNLLRYDDRFSEMMLKYYVDKGLDAEVERFNDNRISPEAMNVFLQLMLRGFAGYPLGESARLGLRTVNLLKRRGKSEYANLAAFDSGRGEFRWLDEIEL